MAQAGDIQDDFHIGAVDAPLVTAQCPLLIPSCRAKGLPDVYPRTRRIRSPRSCMASIRPPPVSPCDTKSVFSAPCGHFFGLNAIFWNMFVPRRYHPDAAGGTDPPRVRHRARRARRSATCRRLLRGPWYMTMRPRRTASRSGAGRRRYHSQRRRPPAVSSGPSRRARPRPMRA